MNLSNAVVKTEVNWQAVCHAADLVADSGVVVWLDGAQVALFYLPGLEQSLYAVDNRDPRSGANIIGRGIVGSLQGELVVAAPLKIEKVSGSPLRVMALVEDNKA